MDRRVESTDIILSRAGSATRSIQELAASVVWLILAGLVLLTACGGSVKGEGTDALVSTRQAVAPGAVRRAVDGHSAATLPITASWPLPRDGSDFPQLVSAVARCGDEFLLLDRRMAIVYHTRFDGKGRRIGARGEAEGQFLEPTDVVADCSARLLHVVDVTGFSTFQLDTGRFVRRFPRPHGFSNRPPALNLLISNGQTLLANGVWPKNIDGDWKGAGADSVHEGARFGMSLNLSSGVTRPLFPPLDYGCHSYSASCWETMFDRLGGGRGWVFAHAEGASAGILSEDGRLVRRITVASKRFRRDGRSLPENAPLERRLAWGQTNSRIDRVIALEDRIAVVYTNVTSRGWKPGQQMQFESYVNLFTEDGVSIESDLRLPGLSVGQDRQHLYVVDYGEGPRHDGAPGRLCEIGVRR